MKYIVNKDNFHEIFPDWPNADCGEGNEFVFEDKESWAKFAEVAFQGAICSGETMKELSEFLPE